MTQTATTAGRSPDDGGQLSRDRRDGQKPGTGRSRPVSPECSSFPKGARSSSRAATSPAAQPKASSPRRPWLSCAVAVAVPEPALRERSALRTCLRTSQALYSDRVCSR